MMYQNSTYRAFFTFVFVIASLFLLAGSVGAANLIVYNNSAPSQTYYLGGET